MQSNEENNDSGPTNVLFIPKLPPLLASWSTLKVHFSQYGRVHSVVLNPQQRSCTVSFETVADAEYAKSKGCIWKNKEFEANYYRGSTLPLDRRATSDEVLGYSELETLWNDDGDDVENFGVAEKQEYTKSKNERIGRRVTKVVASNKSVEKTKDIKMPRKSSSEKKSPKLKSSSEKKIPLIKHSTGERKTRSLMAMYSIKEKQKEAKKKVKEALLELSKKRRISRSKLTEDTDMNISDTPTLSLKDKFNVLEERDKHIRKSLVKSSDVKTAKAVVGTCPDMCPEKERIMREYRRLVSVFEMVPGSQKMDHTIAVKAYVRSSADQEEPLPHELRPEPVLSMTMSYLITKIMPLVDDPEVNISDWYDFCWDRLRGIRKDVIQQRLCSLETVTIIERCARFHICCYDYFWGADPSVFDEKINTENLMNCLQTLRHMYEDLGKEGIKCPNEAEFNAYMILLDMKTGNLMATYQSFCESMLKEERIQTAVKLYLAFNNAMYSQFFKLVKESTYLDACLLQRYFYHVRVQALQTIARAYCPPNKSGTIPLKQMKIVLKFDSAEDTELFCEGHGIMLKENRRDFSLYRNDFFLPDTKIQSCRPSSLITDRRLPLVEAVTGDRLFLHSLVDHQIHSSFSDGKLTEMAHDASDQKNKSSKLITKPIEDDLIEDITDPDEEMSQEPFEGAYIDHTDSPSKFKTKEINYISMDVDDNETRVKQDIVSVPEMHYPVTEFEPVQIKGFDNNNVVSRKHHGDSSGFKFDLSSTKFGFPSESVLQQSTYFGTESANILRTRNNLVSNLIKQNQFDLKVNLIGQSSENVTQAIENYENRSVSVSKSPVECTKASKISNNDSNKSINNNASTPGFSSNFTFKLGTNRNDLLAQEVTNSVGGIEKTSEIIKDTGDTYFAASESFVDSTLKRDFVSNQSSGFQLDKNNFGSSLKVDESSFIIKDDTVINDKDNEMFRKREEERKDRENEQLKELKRKLKEKEKEKELIQLKKDLRQKLKRVTARYFIRKWKQKIEKIKQNRNDFPLLMNTPIEQHEVIWGTALNVRLLPTHSLLNRLKVKRQNDANVSLILNKGLHNTVKYLGNKVAENIVLNNSLKLELRDFNIPFCWKLVISVPFAKDSFFAKKFHDWFTKLFYSSENSQLGIVTEEMTSQNVPVYYCVHLVSGNVFDDQLDKLNGMNGLIFFNISGVEDSVDKCKRFKGLIGSNKGLKPVSVALVNIGKEIVGSNTKLINAVNEKVKRRKVENWIEEDWSDFNSIDRVVSFLTSNVNTSNNIHVCTLYTLFKRTSEYLINILDTSKIVSNEFSSALMDPNRVIDLYNAFFSELESIIINNNWKDYDIVPPEFKDLVLYLNKMGNASPLDVKFNKSRRPNIVKAFVRFKLPKIKPWPPNDASDLLDILDGYCDSIGCNNILPRIIRLIDVDDDVDIVENLNKVPWVNVVDLIVRWLLETYMEDNNKIVVVYDESAISDLCEISFSFKLFYDNIVKT